VPVEDVPNPSARQPLEANGDGNGGGGGGGGGGGSSNSNSHNRAQLALQDIRAIVNQLARTLPAGPTEGGEVRPT
jgi:hypothetical protein